MPNAIVIQGAFYGTRTLNIILHTLKKNPASVVIFSSWDNFQSEELEALQADERFYFIQSSQPTVAGSANRHLQRISSWHGIRRAKALTAEHVLKMRSDQLLRLPNICEFLKSKLQEYGTERLVVGHGGTTAEEMWGKFHISDFWMFGKTERMLLWYDPEGIDMTNEYFNPEMPIHSPEPDFAQVWMRRMNLETFNDIRELLAEHFIVLDCAEVELIYKTIPLDISATEIRSFWRGYGDQRTIRHGDWLKMRDEYIKPNR